MKKWNYLSLHIVLSLLLIAMGVLIELKGQNKINGVAYSFLVIPGFLLALTIFTSHIKYKKHYLFIIVSGVVMFVLEAIIFMLFKLYSTGFLVCLILLVVMAITVAICFIFYIIYLRIK